jgi:hypothetical protein
MLARLRRAKNFVCGVEQALRACSTPHTKSGERRRREQAMLPPSGYFYPSFSGDHLTR